MTFNEVAELFREQYERPYTDRLSKLSRDEVGEILACLEVVARYEWPSKECASLCEDCPPVGYPTDETRCLPCPRRAHG